MIKKKKKAKKNKQLYGKKLKSLKEQVSSCMGKNWSDYKIMQHLELHPISFERIKREIVSELKNYVSNIDPASIYSDYILKCNQLVEELDSIKKKMGAKNQLTALVAAVKQKKDIYDSAIKMGQDLGFLSKQAKEFKLKGNVTFSTMSEKQVKEEIAQKIKEMNVLSNQTIDMRPELLGVVDADMRKYLPKSEQPLLIEAPPVIKKKKKKRLLDRRKL